MEAGEMFCRCSKICITALHGHGKVIRDNVSVVKVIIVCHITFTKQMPLCIIQDIFP
jgi:hypothetical protein